MSVAEELSALEWYVDAGVDEALDETPRDYFAENLNHLAASNNNVIALIAETPAPIAEPRAIAVEPTPMRQFTPAAAALNASLAATITQAQQLADNANTLEELRDAVTAFDGCSIKKTATKTVFGDGNPQSKLLLIGEAPGADEDRQGIPFCGASGQLLDKMLAAIGYDRTRYYISNTVFWRPPGNRQPSTEELAICKPFVEKLIALINPDLIVLVGGTAAKALLNTDTGITRLRGKNYSLKIPHRENEYPTSIIYHPSYLLRQPATKRAAWQDLLAIKAKLSSS